MKTILIAMDTVRADHLGCYGYGRPTSPNVDRLAEEGALQVRCTSSERPGGCNVTNHQVTSQRP